MNVKYLIVTILFLPSVALAADPCSNAKNTIEINECTSNRVAGAEKELARYLAKSLENISDQPQSVQALKKAQASWLQFRKDHCDAIYEMWAGGTTSAAMRGNCVIEQTQRRTHDLWKEYLTFMDSTPALLPEPKLDASRK
jgi:uncharacterized protein YecT (DUF1311 family)